AFAVACGQHTVWDHAQSGLLGFGGLSHASGIRSAPRRPELMRDPGSPPHHGSHSCKLSLWAAFGGARFALVDRPFRNLTRVTTLQDLPEPGGPNEPSHRRCRS